MQADDAALIIEDGGLPLVIALLDRVGRAVTLVIRRVPRR